MTIRKPAILYLLGPGFVKFLVRFITKILCAFKYVTCIVLQELFLINFLKAFLFFFFIGKQFEQYLPLVMGPVLRTAAMKPEVALLDNEDMEGIEGDLDWQFVSLGEQQNFGIKTAGLEDKASACEMLVCYARELKEGFADYAEEVVRLMVPMLKFYFHDGVRTAAAASLPYLLDCAKIKGIR